MNETHTWQVNYIKHDGETATFDTFPTKARARVEAMALTKRGYFATVAPIEV